MAILLFLSKFEVILHPKFTPLLTPKAYFFNVILSSSEERKPYRFKRHKGDRMMADLSFWVNYPFNIIVRKGVLCHEPLCWRVVLCVKYGL